MRRPQHKIWLEAILWVAVEIAFSSSGLDALADYSEYLINQKFAPVQTVQMTQIVKTIA